MKLSTSFQTYQQPTPLWSNLIGDRQLSLRGSSQGLLYHKNTLADSDHSNLPTAVIALPNFTSSILHSVKAIGELVQLKPDRIRG